MNQPITYTKKERQLIIKWWNCSYRSFRFMPDGSVEAKSSGQSPWGLLYTPLQARSHIDARMAAITHLPSIASVESSRQRTTKRRVKHRAQARRFKLSLLAMLVMVGMRGMVSHAQAIESGARHPHQFFDRTNLALFSADVLVRTMDAHSTRSMLANPCRCYVEDNLPPAIAQSTPRMYGYSLGVSGGVIAGAWLAHKHGWHRLERILPMIDIVYDGKDVGNNLTLPGPTSGGGGGRVVTHGSVAGGAAMRRPTRRAIITVGALGAGMAWAMLMVLAWLGWELGKIGAGQ